MKITKKIKSLRNLSILKSLKSNFKKALNKSPLIKELLLNGAFIGDYYRFVHFSQENLVISYKNNMSFYKIEESMILLNKAARFLRINSLNKDQKFVFVGNTKGYEEESSYIFKQIKVPFFPNNIWEPGFFSKSSSNTKRILVIYNIKDNFIAFSEAVSANVPVVAFASPRCDIRNADYPVVLNLEHSGLWYPSFCKVLIKK